MRARRHFAKNRFRTLRRVCHALHNYIKQVYLNSNLFSSNATITGNQLTIYYKLLHHHNTASQIHSNNPLLALDSRSWLRKIQEGWFSKGEYMRGRRTITDKT